MDRQTQEAIHASDGQASLLHLKPLPNQVLVVGPTDPASCVEPLSVSQKHHVYEHLVRSGPVAVVLRDVRQVAQGTVPRDLVFLKAVPLNPSLSPDVRVIVVELHTLHVTTIQDLSNERTDAVHRSGKLELLRAYARFAQRQAPFPVREGPRSGP